MLSSGMGEIKKPGWLLFAEQLAAEFDTHSRRSSAERYRAEVYNLHWKAVREFKYPGSETDWRELIDRLQRQREFRRKSNIRRPPK
jgi:hypothetical protein